MAEIKILFIGDVVGNTGRSIFQKHIKKIQETHKIDGTIVNGENSSSTGRGITTRVVQFFKQHGVNLITTGNHIWQQKEVYAYLDTKTDLLRPLNFPHDTPGTGVGLFSTKNNIQVGVINVQGRVFMRELVSCPFRAVESALTFLKSKTPIIIVDIHAETTAEKMAIAHYFDGAVSAVLGTHTHVQTADERILPKKTAFITDAGMAGSLNGMLGMKKEPIIQNFLTQMPTKFSVDDSAPFVLSGVVVTIDAVSGHASAIERIRIIDDGVVLIPDIDEKNR
jgi:metallophosphoesterase (TIGR00282 family)